MLLLDSCTLLWLVDQQTRLSSTAVLLLRQNAGDLYVLAISAFEISQKHMAGRLRLPSVPEVWFLRAVQVHGLSELPVTSEIAIRATQLPPLHKDPADRILIATAQSRGLDILTPDRLISAYPGVRVRW